MRKLILLTSAFVSLLAGTGFAQTQLVNGNMEAWDNAGTDNQEPQQWNSFKTGNCTLAIGCSSAQERRIERVTDVRPGSTGTYSARIFSTSVWGVIANGNLTTGQIQIGSTTASSSANHNKTLTNNAAHRMPITALPDSIIFWAKFQPGNNSTTSQARMRAVLHDNYDYRDPSTSDNNAPAHVVAEATHNFTRTYEASTYVWKRFAVPFTYTGPATSPAYMLITFTTNMTPGGGSSNDQVWIDDVELKYIPVVITAGTINPLSYTVSASAGASISIPFTKTGNLLANNVFTAQLSDASGSFASPVNLGTLSSANAGTINGTIPAGTQSGTGYRVRVISSSPYQTATPNTSDISIDLASTAIAPTAAQTIVASTNGTTLTATETGTAISRQWKFATVSGGPYSNFTTAEIGTTYTPNFTNAGTYYVVCESIFGTISTRSNEVIVNVVKNQIAPAGTQSLLINAIGATLTVTESPSGSSREWLYATTSGGTYVSFSPAQTGTTYDPQFASAGTYHVVCKSVISGLDVTSNEVVISVGNLNINTGAITGSPFEFSPLAPDASVSVPFSVSGTFDPGNIFTAQLSDANGSFGSPTNIGTLTSSSGGSINATIPSTTASGTGYLIRVIGSSPSTLGSDNGTALVVDQFNNSITPNTAQTFVYTGTGSPITVNESQTSSSREWRVSNVAGGPYVAITPAQTGNTFTPSSPILGTFYVVCASTNQYSDEVISNEVMITVENGSTIATSAVTGSPFYISPSANNQISVNFTSDVIFNSGNVFTAQLSDGFGNFSVPTNIGTLNGSTLGAISATIPNLILDGTGYRIRVVSSDPAVTGTNNGSDLSAISFAVSMTPTDTQFVSVNQAVSPVTLQSTHPNPTVEWKFRTVFIAPFNPFPTPVTGSTFNHTFTSANTYQVIGSAVNSWGDTLETNNHIVFIVKNNSSIDEANENGIKAFVYNNQFTVDLSNSTFQHPKIELVNMAGKVVYNGQLQSNSIQTIPLNLASGVYTYNISEKEKSVTGKILIQY